MNHDTFTDPHRDLFMRGYTQKKPINMTNISELDEDVGTAHPAGVEILSQALRRSAIKLCSSIISANRCA